MSQPVSQRGALLHLITDLDLGGAERVLVRLAAQLGARGWRQSVISLREGGALVAALEASGIATQSLAFGSGSGAANLLHLRRFARAVSPAVVQGWMYHGNLAASVAGWLGGSRAPVLWNVRQCVPDLALEKRSTARIIRWNARLSGTAKHVIFNSALALEQHRRLGFITSRSTVIPNGFDTTRFVPRAGAASELRQRMGWPQDAVVIGLIGRFHPVKGHLDFLEAAAEVHRASPRARFVLAGTGVDAGNLELVAHRARLGLAGAMEFLGPQHDEDAIASLTASLDIACCASHSEAFPNVVGEAMSCGVPCVATETGDVQALLGPAGIIVPPKAPSRFAQALMMLMAMTPDERRSMGAAGRERIESHYSLAHITDAYDALYLRSLQRGT